MKRVFRIFAFALVAAAAVCFGACKSEHKHDYQVLESQNATCVSDGYLRERCKVCGAIREEKTPALGHDYGTDNKCKRCGYEIKATKNLAYLDNDDKTGWLVALGSATDKDIIIPAYQNGKPVVGVHDEGFACLDGGQATGGKNIESVEIADGVKSIGTRAFYGCSALKRVKLPVGMTSVGDLAFRDCTALASVEGGSEVVSIGTNAFYGCTSLTELPSFESLETIGNYAFSGCTRLERANILSATLKTVGTGVFYGCTSLKYATLSGELDTLPQSTFSRCGALIEVRLGGKLKNIGSSAFESCESLKAIRFEGTKEAWKEISKAVDWFVTAGITEDGGYVDYYVYCTDGAFDHNGVESYLPEN